MVKVVLPLYVTFVQLKKLGIHYSRTHLYERMMNAEYCADPFPKGQRLGERPKSWHFWYTPDVIAWLQRRGLPVPDFIEYSL